MGADNRVRDLAREKIIIILHRMGKMEMGTDLEISFYNQRIHLKINKFVKTRKNTFNIRNVPKRLYIRICMD